jgi:hypothetical protein
MDLTVLSSPEMSHPPTGDPITLEATTLLLGIGEAERIHSPAAVTSRSDTAEEDHLHNKDHPVMVAAAAVAVVTVDTALVAAAAAVAVVTVDTALAAAAAVAVEVDTALEAAAVVDHHHTRWLTILHFDHPSHLPNRTSRHMTSSRTSPLLTNGTRMPSL